MPGLHSSDVQRRRSRGRNGAWFHLMNHTLLLVVGIALVIGVLYVCVLYLFCVSYHVICPCVVGCVHITWAGGESLLLVQEQSGRSYHEGIAALQTCRIELTSLSHAWYIPYHTIPGALSR